LLSINITRQAEVLLMPHWLQRKILLPIVFIGVAALTVRCSPTSAPVQRANGLTCQPTKNAAGAMDCSFKCPDGRLLSLPEAMASQSKDQLNFLFCGVPLPAPKSAPGVQGSSPAATVPTAAVPLLNQQVDICDPLKGVINFVLAQPPQDLTGKKLVVDIQGQETPCSISSIYAGELSCKLPPNTSFPTSVIVRVDDQVVNIFPYSGGDCEGRPGFHDTSVQTSGAAAPQPPPVPQPGPHPGGPGGHGPHPPHQPKPPHGHGHGLGVLLGILPI
jgi:hypothetical protein